MVHDNYSVHFIALALIVIAVIPTVSALDYSSTENDWTIRASDVVCTGSACAIPSTVCNDNNTSRAFDFKFVAAGVVAQTTTSLQQVKRSRLVFVPAEQTLSAALDDSSNSDLQQNNNTTNTARGSYVSEEYTDVERVDVPASTSLSEDGRALTTLSGLSFSPFECKDFVISAVNTIGGTWKYDVNFLDPFINATQYEIGNLSNGSNIWPADMNTTSSSVASVAGGYAFTLGYSSYTLTEDIAPAPDSQAPPASSSERFAENFSLSTTTTIGQVQIGLYKTGTPASDVTVRIETASGVNPSGTLACPGATATIPAAAISSGYGTYNVSLGSPCSLTANTQYFVHYTPSYTDASNFISWRVDTTSPPYAKGMRFTFSGTWSNTAVQDFNVALYNSSGYYLPANNVFESVPIAIAQDVSTFTPVWKFTAYGGKVAINATCNADESSPSWTNNLTNNTLTNCPVPGNSFKYRILLNGNTTDSPIMQNFTVAFGLWGNEATGRQAILSGIAASPASTGTIYTDQQVYERLANTSQYLALFDVFLASGNKRYAFNYNQNATPAHPAFYNITPVLYVWQAYNLTVADIKSNVTALISSTYYN